LAAPLAICSLGLAEPCAAKAWKTSLKFLEAGADLPIAPADLQLRLRLVDGLSRKPGDASAVSLRGRISEQEKRLQILLAGGRLIVRQRRHEPHVDGHPVLVLGQAAAVSVVAVGGGIEEGLG
jgi:hypothetical protein